VDPIQRQLSTPEATARATRPRRPTQQVQIIGYVDDFKLPAIATLGPPPLLTVFPHCLRYNEAAPAPDCWDR
jgi:hypothetical protein